MPLFHPIRAMPSASDREQQVRDVKQGGFLRDLMGSSPDMREWSKKRKNAVKGYRQERRRTEEQLKRDRKELQHGLDTREDQIQRRYRIDEFRRKGDPRLEKAARKAEGVFDLYERRELRKFKEDAKKRLRSVEKQRDVNIREATKTLRKERYGG